MEGMIGEIRMFGGNFAPRKWAFCEGQLLPIAEYTALFSILGCTYGGDCETDFRLPDLRGRAAMHAGTGAGLAPRPLGQKGGAETVTLIPSQIPSHSHIMQATSDAPDSNDPSGKALGAGSRSVSLEEHFGDSANPVNMGSVVGNTGGGQSHNNSQPCLAVSFIICLEGVFPSRS